MLRRLIFLIQFQIAQFDFNGMGADEEFRQGQHQRSREKDERSGEEVASGRHAFGVDGVHADQGNDEARDTEDLHVADDAHAAAQVFDLRVNERLFGVIHIVVTVVQIAHHVGQRQKAVGVGQHNQTDSRKEQGRRVDVDVHGVRISLNCDCTGRVVMNSSEQRRLFLTAEISMV